MIFASQAPYPLWRNYKRMLLKIALEVPIWQLLRLREGVVWMEIVIKARLWRHLSIILRGLQWKPNVFLSILHNLRLAFNLIPCFVLQIFYRFGHYPCFATDVEKYLHELNEEEKAELLDKISKKFAVYSEVHTLGRTVTVFRIQEICSSMWKKSVQGTFVTYLLL